MHSHCLQLPADTAATLAQLPLKNGDTLTVREREGSAPAGTPAPAAAPAAAAAGVPQAAAAPAGMAGAVGMPQGVGMNGHHSAAHMVSRGVLNGALSSTAWPASTD